MKKYRAKNGLTNTMYRKCPDCEKWEKHFDQVRCHISQPAFPLPNRKFPTTSEKLVRANSFWSRFLALIKRRLFF